MKNLSRWFPFLLCVAAVLAYSNSFSAPFIMDDRRMVIENASLHTLWPPWKAILCPPRWVSDLSFALNVAIGGYTPADFRVTNILIHTIVSLFLYGIVRRTLRLPRLQPTFGEYADPLALTTALLWVVHPLGTNCVTYVAQRIEAIMALFLLATLYCFIRTVTSHHPRRWAGATIAFCAVGMGTKEIMATAPLLLFLYDGIFISPSWSAAWRTRWKLHLALWLTTAIFGLLLLMNMGLAVARNEPLLGRLCSPWQYLLTQTQVITHYLRLVYWPDALCINYRWPIATELAAVWPTTLSLSLLGMGTLIGLLTRKTFAFPLAAMFVILAPTSSFLPIPDAAFEHRMYLPMAGLLALTVTVFFAAWLRLVSRLESRRLAGAGFFLLAFGIATCALVLTRTRNTDFLSEDTLWQDVIRKRPGNFLGYVALANDSTTKGRNAKAIRILEDILPSMPDYSRMSFPEIVQARRTNPSNPDKEYSMAHSILGFAYLNLGRTNESVRHLREAIRVYPLRPTPYLNMGRIAMADGKLAESAFWLKQAYARNPRNQDVLCTLASVESMRGNWDFAVRLYRETLRLNPMHGFARSQLAWIRATCPVEKCRDGATALQLAQPLVAMSRGRSPRAYDILGAAYAEAGQFEKAVESANQALQLLSRTEESRKEHSGTPDAGQAMIRKRMDEISGRIALYKQGKPYRETPQP